MPTEDGGKGSTPEEDDDNKVPQVVAAAVSRVCSVILTAGLRPQDQVTLLLISYHNIGWELACLGKAKQAHRWYHKALEMALVRLGEEAPITQRLQKLVAGRAVEDDSQGEGNQGGESTEARANGECGMNKTATPRLMVYPV